MNLQDVNPSIEQDKTKTDQLYEENSTLPVWFRKDVQTLFETFCIKIKDVPLDQRDFMENIALRLGRISYDLEYILTTQDVVLLAEDFLKRDPIFISSIENASDLNLCFEKTLSLCQSIDAGKYSFPKALGKDNPDWKILQELIRPFEYDLLDRKLTDPEEIKTRFLTLVKENSAVFFSAIRFERNKERWLEENIFPRQFEKAIELARLVIHRFQISQQLDKVPGFEQSQNKITDIERIGGKPIAIKQYFGNEAHPEMLGRLNMFFKYGSGSGNYDVLSKKISVLIDEHRTQYDVFYTMVHELVHYISRKDEEKKTFGVEEHASPDTISFNEALTEKLARIIVSMNLELAIQLPGYHPERGTYQEEIAALNSFKDYLEANGIKESFLYSALLSDPPLIDKFYALLIDKVYSGRDIIKLVSQGKKLKGLFF